jgi:hypothetical protein
MHREWIIIWLAAPLLGRGRGLVFAAGGGGAGGRGGRGGGGLGLGGRAIFTKRYALALFDTRPNLLPTRASPLALPGF